MEKETASAEEKPDGQKNETTFPPTPPVDKPRFKIALLGIVIVLIMAGCFTGYKLLSKGRQDNQGTQSAERPTNQPREKGQIHVSFIPPAETVVWSSALDDLQQWQWSPPIKVTIENKTGVDLVIPTFGDFYASHPQSTYAAQSAADDLEDEMRNRVNSGKEKYNTNLAFRYAKEGSIYGFGRKGDDAEWVIPAGQTATENFYLEANNVSSTCPGITWNKLCTLKDVRVELSFGKGLYEKVELTNLEEGTGYILSEPQDINTMMVRGY